MRPFRTPLDRYHGRHADDPVEEAVFGYLGEGVADDLLHWLRKVVDDETAAFIDTVIDDEVDHEADAAADLRAVLDSEPGARRGAARAARRMIAAHALERSARRAAARRLPPRRAHRRADPGAARRPRATHARRSAWRRSDSRCRHRSSRSPAPDRSLDATCRVDLGVSRRAALARAARPHRGLVRDRSPTAAPAPACGCTTRRSRRRTTPSRTRTGGRPCSKPGVPPVVERFGPGPAGRPVEQAWHEVGECRLGDGRLRGEAGSLALGPHLRRPRSSALHVPAARLGARAAARRADRPGARRHLRRLGDASASARSTMDGPGAWRASTATAARSDGAGSTPTSTATGTLEIVTATARRRRAAAPAAARAACSSASRDGPTGRPTRSWRAAVPHPPAA